MNETSKAMRRRLKEEADGGFKWSKVFKGKGIDVGCGSDKLPYKGCVGFDSNDGDANCLSQYFDRDSFDYLHASQCLEHMHNPFKALDNWIDVVKPNGYLVITVPSWELYEYMRWPSVYNPDHKSTWSMWQSGSPAGSDHVFIPSLVEHLKAQGHEVPIARLIDENYNYDLGMRRVDQTWKEEDGVECWIELVIQKGK